MYALSSSVADTDRASPHRCHPEMAIFLQICFMRNHSQKKLWLEKGSPAEAHLSLMKTLRYESLKVSCKQWGIYPKEPQLRYLTVALRQGQHSWKYKTGLRSTVKLYFIFFSNLAWFSGTACCSSGINKLLPWFKSGWHPKTASSLTHWQSGFAQRWQEQNVVVSKLGKRLRPQPHQEEDNSLFCG